MSATKIASHAEKVLDYVEVTGAVMEKVSADLAQREKQAEEVSKLVPLAAQALLDNQRILPHEKEAAMDVLKDPVRALEVLIKTAQHRNDTERTQLGRPVEMQKKASYNSLNNNYVGRRAHPDEPESYKAFKRGLGL